MCLWPELTGLNWIPFFSAIGGGLMVVISNVATTYFAHWMKERSERRSLASAFAGEITGLLEITRRRKYLETIDGLVQDPIQCFKVPANSEYFKVYANNVGNLGKLPVPLPMKVACFYARAESILEDFKNPPEIDDAVAIKAFNQELYVLLKETMEIGNSIIAELNAVE